jgi:NADH-quinone oxidoreductase subunit J
MNISLDTVIFVVLALVIIVFSVLTVTTTRILRAATYLLFVLFAAAGIYFQLNYSFLGAVQLMVYVGGIIVLYVFSILLTSSRNMDDRTVKVPQSRFWTGLISAAVGFVICAFLILKNTFKEQVFEYGEVKMDVIGKNILGMDKFQYLLPFELMGLLLLACVIGAIVIARKR